jgi:hypothetical protein
MAKADETARKSKERLVDVVAAFVADAQAPTAMQPSQGALDDPAMAAEPLTRFEAAPGDTRTDAALAGGPAAFGIVVAFVRMHLRGPAARGAAPLADARHGVQQGGEAQRVVRVRRAEERGERKPAAFHKEVMFGAELAAVGGTRPRLRPPFSAGTAAASKLARDQSIWSAAPKRSSSAWCSRSHTPACCQSRSRRQQLIPLPQPISAGKYSHGMPVRSTKSSPVNACRSGIGGRPPLGRGGRGGSSGATTAHSSSVTSSLAISAVYHH